MSGGSINGGSSGAAGISTQNGSIALIDDPDVDGNISQTVFFDPPFATTPIITGLTLRRLLNSTIKADDMDGILVTDVAEYGFSFTVNTNLTTLPEPLFVDWEVSHGEVMDAAEAPPSVYTDSAFSMQLVGEGGTAQIRFKTIDGLGVIVDWGDGTIETAVENVLLNHTYASAYTGLVHFASVSGGAITYFYSGLGKFVTDIADLPRTLTTLDFRGTGSNIYGDIKDAPPAAQTLWLQGSSMLAGDIKDIPENFGNSIFLANGPGVLTGDIGTIPATSLNNSVQINGLNNTIYGLVQDISVGVFGGSMQIAGQNTISGDIGLMDSAHEIGVFSVTGQNTISGDIGLMPLKLGTTTFFLQGNNIIYGNIEDWPVNVTPLTTIDIRGFNTIGGDLGVANFSTGTFNLYGNNTIGGDVANFNGDLVTSIFNLHGNNTLAGDIANIPTTLATIDFIVHDNNTLAGDLKNKPVGPGARHFQIYGNADLTYSGGITLLQKSTSTNYYAPLIASGNGLTSVEVDQFLIDTAAVGWLSTTINLTGSNAPRTAASDAAVVTLNGNGVSVVTN